MSAPHRTVFAWRWIRAACRGAARAAVRWPIGFAILGLAIFVASAAQCNAPAPGEPPPSGAAARPAPSAPPGFADDPLLGRLASERVDAPAPPRPPAPPPLPDGEAARRACHAFDGTWHCAPGQRPTLAATSSERGSTFPNPWTVPDWYIDPSNLTGLASDTNSCTSATTPCLTYNEVQAGRWGCLGGPNHCARLRQNTMFHWLSGHTNDSDPVPFQPSVENNSLVIHQGTIVQVASITLSGTVAKNRGAQQLLNANLGASGAVGQLLINATHPSHAIVYKLVSGTTFAISQPMNIGTLPGALPQNLSRTEVDTWADGDTVTLNTIPFVNFSDLRPTIEDGGANGVGTNASVYLSQVGVYDPATKGDGLIVSANVRGFDVIWQRSPHYNGLGNYVSSYGCSNCWYQNGLGGFGTAAGTTSCNITAGIITTGTGQFANTSGTTYDADVIINTAVASSAGRNIFGLAYIDTGTQIAASSGDVVLTNLLGYTGSPKLWGPGPSGTMIQIQNSNHVTIPLGAGACASAIATTTANLRFDGVAFGYVAIPTAGALGPFNVAFACAGVDANMGATQGCFTSGGGSSLCNF